MIRSILAPTRQDENDNNQQAALHNGFGLSVEFVLMGATKLVQLSAGVPIVVMESGWCAKMPRCCSQLLSALQVASHTGGESKIHRDTASHHRITFVSLRRILLYPAFITLLGVSMRPHWRGFGLSFGGTTEEAQGVSHDHPSEMLHVW